MGPVFVTKDVTFEARFEPCDLTGRPSFDSQFLQQALLHALMVLKI